MHFRSASAVLAAFLLLSVYDSAAAQDQIFLEFKFEDLRFAVWPAGLENRGGTDGKGSAITVHVKDVKIEQEAAIELRYCIDEPAYCGNSGADGDGDVEPLEVQSFENLTKFAIRGKVKRVDQMLDALRSNLSVDGVGGKNSGIFSADFQGAEGPVDSPSPILATIEAKVTFDNDPRASRHKIHVGNLSLKQDGFTYTNAKWVMAIKGWRFDQAATDPPAAKTHVNSQGYFSSQAQFEKLSEDGFDLSIVKDAARKKAPGPDAALILLALPLAILAVRYRK